MAGWGEVGRDEWRLTSLRPDDLRSFRAGEAVAAAAAALAPLMMLGKPTDSGPWPWRLSLETASATAVVAGLGELTLPTRWRCSWLAVADLCAPSMAVSMVRVRGLNDPELAMRWPLPAPAPLLLPVPADMLADSPLSPTGSLKTTPCLLVGPPGTDRGEESWA